MVIYKDENAYGFPRLVCACTGEQLHGKQKIHVYAA